jgi:parallel beta-helix repeat protein
MASYYKAAFVIILFSLTLTSLFDVSIQPVKASPKTIVVPQDYSTINAAIAGSSNGDTIFVKKGVYNENIVIYKSITLEGEDKALTTIDGSGKGTVVWINANITVLSGFTIQNSGKNFTDSGIYLNCSMGSSISDNLVINNNIGIYMLESAESHLENNNLSENKFNFGVYSSSLNGYIQDIGSSNTVDGKPVIYWVNQSDKQTPKNAGYVAAINCSDITVSGASLEKNWQNLLFAYTTNSIVTKTKSTLGEDSVWLIESYNCTLTGNNISENIWGGLALVNSSGCTLEGNSLKGNGGYGIFLSYSSDNAFYHNNFIANPKQAWLYGENSNSWDIGYPSGGNYWSNYTGADSKSGGWQNQTGRDGIGDTPYVIDSNNVDNYPLMKPWGTGFSEASIVPIEFYTVVIAAIISALVVGAAYLAKERREKNRENPKKDLK